MSTNLVSLALNYLTPDMIARIASALGLDKAIAGKAVTAMVPALLGSFASVAATPDGARKLAGAISQQSPSILDTLASSIGGAGQQGLVSGGVNALGSLLGTSAVPAVAARRGRPDPGAADSGAAPSRADEEDHRRPFRRGACAGRSRSAPEPRATVMVETNAPPSPYRFTLFVTGANARSLRAVANVRRFCANELGGAYELEVVDLYVHPERAQADQIVAAPTLVRHSPRPLRYAIGDLSDTRSLRAAIGGA